MVTTLTVNGVTATTVAAADTPLLYVLRNDLDLKATRFGCGAGDCGVCMVLVDGRAEKSCQMPVESIAARRVDTVESLLGTGPDEDVSPVVRSLLQFQAGQCGYCLPGIAITATALLARCPRPTRDDVVEALDGNLCRCGSHARIIAAVLHASGQSVSP